jgi:phosphoribosylformimino-5-aminoimidazole carboxamide ribotide isomerase
MITIIPAIDIIEGKCVRLTRGEFQAKKIYNEDPLEVAKKFEDVGIQRLHLVDLDGAKEMEIRNWRVLEKIANKTSLKIDFGGGVQSDDDLKIAFNCGATQVTAGSIAVKDRKKVITWLSKFGNEKIILGADVKDKKIAIHAWREKTELDLLDFIDSYFQEGIRYVICTDISRDGLLEGPTFSLYQTIKEKFPQLYLIASGGISSLREVDELNQLGIEGVIIGKAIYENRIGLEELKKYYVD